MVGWIYSTSHVPTLPFHLRPTDVMLDCTLHTTTNHSNNTTPVTNTCNSCTSTRLIYDASTPVFPCHCHFRAPPFAALAPPAAAPVAFLPGKKLGSALMERDRNNTPIQQHNRERKRGRVRQELTTVTSAVLCTDHGFARPPPGFAAALVLPPPTGLPVLVLRAAELFFPSVNEWPGVLANTFLFLSSSACFSFSFLCRSLMGLSMNHPPTFAARLM